MLVDKYNIEILEDEDWGMHKAEDGYSVRITPILTDIEYVKDIPRLAAEKVAHDKKCSWLDILEACEDGDEELIAVMEEEISKLRKIYKKETISVSDDIVSQVKLKYPDAVNVCAVTKTVYIKKIEEVVKMKILWLSRHNMTNEQITDLKRIYGDDIEIKHHTDTVNSWKDVVEVGSDCNVLAVVLPPAILADLVNPRNNMKPVIRAIANRVETGNTIVNPATGKEEKEFKFVHAGWEKIIKIEVITERL